MNTVCRTNRALVVLAAACSVGGILIGTSCSQEPKPPADDTAAGRYQISANNERIWMVDTKTGQLWEKQYSASSEGSWRTVAAPWDANKKALKR
jgi:hypothetical protein